MKDEDISVLYDQHTVSQKVSKTQLEKSALVNEAAHKRLEEKNIKLTKKEPSKQLTDKKSGKFLAKISDDDWQEIIERVAAGELIDSISKSFDIDRMTISRKCKRDKSYAELYKEAREQAALTIFEETRQVARGVEGKSSGNVRRDELIVKTDMEYAKRIAPHIFGDKLQIDQRSINITINDDDIDW